METLGSLAAKYLDLLKAQEHIDSAMLILVFFMTQTGIEKRHKNVPTKFPKHLKESLSQRNFSQKRESVRQYGGKWKKLDRAVKVVSSAGEDLWGQGWRLRKTRRENTSE